MEFLVIHSMGLADKNFDCHIRSGETQFPQAGKQD
jgi:hypothetical protein